MPSPGRLRLGVNIDHVATLRQARRATEPDPVHAAVLAEMGGAAASRRAMAAYTAVSAILMTLALAAASVTEGAT